MKKLALDFDGTIADTNLMKSKLILERHGKNIPPWQCDKTLCVPQIGLEPYRALGDVVYERDSVMKTPPVNDALKFLPRLAEQAGLYLLTARPLRRLEFAREWLIKYEVIDCFKQLVSSHIEESLWRPKLEVCQENNFDLLLEDDAQHFLKNGYSSIQKVLIKDGCQSKIEVPAGVNLVCSWQEFFTWCQSYLKG